MNGPQKESTILRGVAVLVGLLFVIALPLMLFLEPNDAANDFEKPPVIMVLGSFGLGLAFLTYGIAGRRFFSRFSTLAKPVKYIFTVIGIVVFVVLTLRENKAEHVVTAHNTYVGLEISYVDSLNGLSEFEGSEEQTNQEVKNIANQFYSGVLNVDISKCPDDYQSVFRQIIQVIEREKNSIERFDLDDLEETRRRRGELTLKLIETAKKYGVLFDS